MLNQVNTRIEAVTIFQDRALVSRRGEFDFQAAEHSGPDEVDLVFKISELPLLMDDSSLRIELEDNHNLLLRDVKIELIRKKDIQDDSTQLRDEIELLQRQLEDIRAQRKNQLIVIEEIKKWLEAPLPGPPIKDGRQQEKPPFPVAEYNAYIDVLTAKLQSEQTTLQHIERDLLELEREYIAKRELQVTPEPAWGEDPSKRWFKNVIIRLTKINPTFVGGQIIFNISYCLNGTRWAPTYSLQLDSQKKQAQLAMNIRLAQRTGEDWGGVKLTFSAASLRRVTQLPELPSRRLGRVQPPKPTGLRPAPEPNQELFSSYDQWFTATETPPILGPEQKYPFFIKRAENLTSRGRNVLQHDFLPGLAKAGKVMPKKRKEKADFTKSMKRAAPPPPPVQVAPAAPLPVAAASIDATFLAAGADEELEDMLGAEPEMLMDLAESSPEAMEVPQEKSLAVPKMSKRRARAPSFTGAGTVKGDRPDFEEIKIDTGALPQQDQIVDYQLFELHGPEDRTRGRLLKQEQVTSPDLDVHEAFQKANRLIKQLPSPGDAVASHFFHVYPSHGRADVPSDGNIHTVPIEIRGSDLKLEYRSAPLTAPQVYRVLKLENPFNFPLPRGVVAIYHDGAFAFNTHLAMAAIGGEVSIPMGVEERIKVTRNARFHEEEAGLITAQTELTHQIEIEVKSQMAERVTLELIDRVPITDEEHKEIEIEELESQPQSEKITTYEDQVIRGGRRFSLELDPGQKQRCTFAYKVTIPAKKEIIGGNRRE
ncbi:DUF4139 domain-containing protein [candidate division CSSED10-310 bacterium]|uniref:DUF4139 domain-containing protein n=1 Tax=candidate division CSSED10-310 bacterium TaxID=2855610 RepID=A0ABV6Z2Y1_UNCC1